MYKDYENEDNNENENKYSNDYGEKRAKGNANYIMGDDKSSFGDYIKINDFNIKNENLKRRICVLTAFTIIFAIGFILFGILYTDSNLRGNSYGNSLEAGYQRAVYELSDNINNIEVNLSKVQVSEDASLQRKYLQLVCDNCKYAQSNFQILPIKLSTTREGVAFINKMDGYCTSVIAGETAMTESQKVKIQQLHGITLELKKALNDLISKIMGGYSILQASEKDMGELDDFSSNFEGLGADSISYPSMIFDGPFSDSLYNKEIKGLTEVEVDKETAQKNLEAILADFYQYDKIEYEGETKGDFVTYDFSIYVKDKIISASLSKRGGFLLNLSGYADESETAEQTIDDAIKTAIKFAGLAGASDMKCVWSDSQKGVAFINLAPVINNVIYYPDLIKVKVDLSTGNVVGYDAVSYAYNHTDRETTTPTLSAVQARDLLDLKLNINAQKLCIIPLEYGGEVLAYEFYCEYYGAEYYVYINAFDGDEERVMKVVSTTDEGNLTK